MSKKRLSEEEKAQTELTEQLLADEQTPKLLRVIVTLVMEYHKMDHRIAVCALRDYFQLEVAKERDLMAKGLDEDTQRLRAELLLAREGSGE